MDVNAVLRDIPDYQHFLAVREMDASSLRLAADHPEVVELAELGRSRNGHPIYCLKIGSGRQNALAFGCPHPNEPVGAMMLEYLARRLAEDDALREELGFTWYIIKSSDPDGTMLNEGWFKGPFTLLNYASNFFRPAPHQQVEWSFPIQYKTLSFNSPLPETTALMRIIDQTKPAFVYSLHNAGFGGAYWYISDEAPEVYDKVTQLALDQGVPLRLGEPEVPYARQLSQAVYQQSSTRDSYEYYEKFLGKDPATIITHGGGSYDYAGSVCDTFSLVCEVPYFFDPRIQDTSPSDMLRRDAVLRSCDFADEYRRFLETHLAKAGGYLFPGDPLAIAVKSFVSSGRESTSAKRKWAMDSEECRKVASVAQKFTNLQVTRFYSMLTVGMLARAADRALRAESGDGAARAALASARDAASAKLRESTDILDRELTYYVIPIRKLVSLQLASALYFSEHVRKRA